MDLDPLTGLISWGHFYKALEGEVADAQRHGRRLALLQLDIHNFRAVNDVHGHAVGDQVLAEFARRLREIAVAPQIPARIGADHFAVMLPDSTAAEANELGSRLRLNLANAPIPPVGSIDVFTKVAELQPGDDFVSLLERGSVLGPGDF